MKTSLLICACLAAVLLGTGCASASKGTSVQLHANTTVPGSTVSLNGEKPLPLPGIYKIKKNKADLLTFTGNTPDGRIQTIDVAWVDKDGKLWFIGGGVGWAILTGVGCVVDIGIDYYTKAYRDPSTTSIMFDFPTSPALPQRQIVDVMPSATSPGRPARLPSVHN